MPNYVTFSEVRSYKVRGELVNLDDYTDAEITSAINLSEGLVESYCGDKWYTFTATQYFDGGGLATLTFYPQVTIPLTFVTSVEEIDVDRTTVLYTYIENEDFLWRSTYLELVLSVNLRRARKRFEGRGVWPLGQQNIKVVGVWGKSEIPEEVKESVKLLTIQRLMPDESPLSPSGVARVDWPDHEVEFYNYFKEHQANTTGYRETDVLLQNLIVSNITFGAVPDKVVGWRSLT